MPSPSKSPATSEIGLLGKAGVCDMSQPSLEVLDPTQKTCYLRDIISAQLTICVLACEFPFDPSSRGVALLLPLSDFCLKQLRRGDALSGALPIHNPDFDLRHVQPSGVLGGVVELDALQQRRCCSLTQHIHESLPEVRVEVVQNEMNDERRRIHRLYKVLDEGHKVHFGAAGGDLDAPLFALGFDGYKEIARPVAPVFVVLTSIPARLDSYRRTGLAKQLLALLIHAHHGFPRIVRTSIETQQPIHPVAILGRDPADAPHQLAPGLAVVFFNIRRTVSRLTLASPGRWRAAAVNRRIVHRLCPLGGALQTSVGSEVAHRVAPMLATVRRSNCACSFPAHSFHKDSIFRDATSVISKSLLTIGP